MKFQNYLLVLVPFVLMACSSNQNRISVKVYETSAAGNKLELLEAADPGPDPARIQLFPEERYQTIIGFGGAFTESSAYLLNQLSDSNRSMVLEAYFGSSGARYSLTRTHINSCDFSLSNYSYAPVAGDMGLKHFSIEEDRDDVIPMIKEAMEVSEEGFKILASPWTAPPWMKDNNDWVGGKLLPEYYNVWALFFSKYIKAYKDEGIDVWGVTFENEPLGNGNNWESMHFTPEEMVDFVNNHLGPTLESEGQDVKIFGYDQNRGEEMIEWVDAMYHDEKSSRYFDGTAVHWYASTFEWFPKALTYAHELAPDKYLINSEACVDAEVPHWHDDAWYWKKEATDWGWDWAPEEDKKYHPKYVPVYRYARDIIGCLNNWVEGWIDWNMILDRKGGPNWANNWCIAPVIVDPKQDEVYFTPLYYTLAHFSKYIRPGAVRIGFDLSDEVLMMTAVKNPDGSIVIVLLNQTEVPRDIVIVQDSQEYAVQMDGKALQTVVIKPSI